MDVADSTAVPGVRPLLVHDFHSETPAAPCLLGRESGGYCSRKIEALQQRGAKPEET